MPLSEIAAATAASLLCALTPLLLARLIGWWAGRS